MIPATLSARLRRLGNRRKASAHELDRAKLQRKLEELELRFCEYDHRVRNNMQMMLTLLASAAHSTSNVEVRSVLNSLTHKMSSLLRVQAILRGAGHSPRLRSDEFISELAHRIQEGSPQRFALVTELEKHDLPSSAALPLGLIVNELLTNAIKHGIGPNQGRVRVTFKSLGDMLELRVEDNGRGIGASAPDSERHGIRMVRQLASQLHGSFETPAGPGGRCLIRFQRPQ